MAAELDIGCNLETKSRRDKCSSELRTAKPKILMANSPCPLFLKVQDSNVGKPNQLESTESTVITIRSHLTICFEQVHRGDHFIFGHLSNASSWSKLHIRKPVAEPSESEVNLFLTRSMAGVRPRGYVGAAWQAMKDAKSSNADGIGDAVLRFDNVDKTQNGFELEEKERPRAEETRHCEEEEEQLK